MTINCCSPQPAMCAPETTTEGVLIYTLMLGQHLTLPQIMMMVINAILKYHMPECVIGTDKCYFSFTSIPIVLI